MSRSTTIKFLALATILAGGYYGYTHFMAPGQGGPDMGGAPPVSVAAVIDRPVQQWHEFTGRLVAVDQVEIRPRVSGTVDAIYFADGAMVKQGDKLFTIDPRPYEAAYSRAQGALSSAQAQLQLARTQMARGEKLFADKAISQSDFDQRKNALNVASANAKSAQADLETAKLNLDYTAITAPISGKVGRAEITVGNLVETGPNAPVLTTLVSISPIYADFDIDEATYLKYAQATTNKDNVPVMLALAGENDAMRSGRIQAFDNKLDQASGTIRVRAVFENPDSALVPGLFARIKIGAAEKQDAMLITDRAIGTDQSKKFVFVVGDDNKAMYREIKLGGIADGLRVVNDGLKAGDKIIVSGLQRARPGAPVTPQLVPMDAKETPSADANAQKEPPEVKTAIAVDPKKPEDSTIAPIEPAAAAEAQEQPSTPPQPPEPAAAAEGKN